jgi:hypothetical protein
VHVDAEPYVADKLYEWLVGELRRHREKRVLGWRDLLEAYCEVYGGGVDNIYALIEQLPSGEPEPTGEALDLYLAIKRVEREGIVTILPKLQSGATEITPMFLVITAHGRRALAHEQLSPALPDFASRLRATIPGLSDLALERFEDAGACLGAGLVRPCAVMLGVAYEDVVKQLCDELANKIALPENKLKEHKKRVDALDALFEQEKSAVPQKQQASLRQTFILAEELRRARNTAAHFGPAEMELPRVRALFGSALWVLGEWWVFRDELR